MKVYTVDATMWLGAQPIYKVRGPYEAHWVKVGGDRLFLVKVPRLNLDRSRREEGWTSWPRKKVYTSRRGARIAMGKLNAQAQRKVSPEDVVRTARITLVDKKNDKVLGRYDMEVDHKTDRVTKFDKVKKEKPWGTGSGACLCYQDERVPGCPVHDKKPNPGSDAAIKLGCTCPVLDNAHGKGCGYGPNTFWINENCPIHAKKGKK